jgi:hypothetical protein
MTATFSLLTIAIDTALFSFLFVIIDCPHPHLLVFEFKCLLIYNVKCSGEMYVFIVSLISN